VELKRIVIKMKAGMTKVLLTFIFALYAAVIFNVIAFNAHAADEDGALFSLAVGEPFWTVYAGMNFSSTTTELMPSKGYSGEFAGIAITDNLFRMPLFYYRASFEFSHYRMPSVTAGNGSVESMWLQGLANSYIQLSYLYVGVGGGYGYRFTGLQRKEDLGAALSDQDKLRAIGAFVNVGIRAGNYSLESRIFTRVQNRDDGTSLRLVQVLLGYKL